MATKSQLKAAKKWADNNKDKRKIIRYRSYTKKFVNELASDEDLKNIIKLAKNRLEENNS